ETFGRWACGDFLKHAGKRRSVRTSEGEGNTGAVIGELLDHAVVPFCELREGMRSLAQAFDRRQRGDQFDHEIACRLEIGVAQRRARIRGMQLGALLAPKLLELVTERSKRIVQSIAAA